MFPSGIEEVQKEVLGAPYKRGSSLEEAPESFDCLTLVHYLFQNIMKAHIELTYIGNMPRQLDYYFEWSGVEVKVLEPGDLMFVQRRFPEKKDPPPGLISHVGVCINPNTILHATPIKNSVIAESIEHFLKDYKQTLNLAESLKYIDPRDTFLRRKHGGEFTTKKEQPQIFSRKHRIPTPTSADRLRSRTPSSADADDFFCFYEKTPLAQVMSESTAAPATLDALAEGSPEASKSPSDH